MVNLNNILKITLELKVKRMLENQCEVCKLYLKCNKPKMSGVGSTNNPKIVFIIDTPSKRDDIAGQTFSKSEANDIIRCACASDITNTYFTYAVKCCPYSDPIIKGEVRDSTPNEKLYCKDKLIKELSFFDPEKTILMTLGGEAYTAMTGEIVKPIHAIIGIERKIKVGNKEFRLIPNFHPAYGVGTTKTQDKARIVSIIKKALGHDEYKGHYKILSPEVGIKVLETILTKDIEYITYDLETKEKIPWLGNVIMLSFCEPDSEVGYSIPLQYKPVDTDVEEKFMDDNLKDIDEVISKFNYSKEIIAKLKVAVQNVLHKFPVLGHYLKYDLKWSHVHNFCDLTKVRVQADTAIPAHLVLGDPSISYGLKELCVELFNLGTGWDDPVDVILGTIKKPENRTFDRIATVILSKYAALDAYFTNRLYKLLRSRVTSGQKHIEEILNDSVIVFSEAEVKGVYVDKMMYNYLKPEYEKNITESYNELCKYIPEWIKPKMEPLREKNNSPRKRKRLTEQQLLEGAFSPGSTTDIKDILYNYFNLPKLRITKSSKKSTSCIKEGSTESEAIIELKDWIIKNVNSKEDKYREQAEHAKILHAIEFIDKLLVHKKFSKLYSTYIKNLPDNMYGSDFHKPEYNITGTVTGRLSSGFHTIPKTSDLKRLYISRWASDGGLIMNADFSQLELRVLASLSEETGWIEAYKKGLDLHKQTAAAIYHVTLDEVTKIMRDSAKTINFGIIYGKGDKSVASDLNITEVEAKKLKSNLLDDAPAIKSWIKGQEEYVVDQDHIVTAFNRVIKINEEWMVSSYNGIYGPNKGAKLRKAVNYPIQSTASDLVLSTIIRVYKEIKRRGLRSLIIGAIHDAILIDIYPGEFMEVNSIVKYEAEVVNKEKYKLWLKCPIQIDVQIGYSWGGLIEPKFESTEGVIRLHTKEANRKDVLILKNQFLKVYKNVNLEIIKDEPITEYAMDTSVKDSARWETKIEMSDKIM